MGPEAHVHLAAAAAPSGVAGPDLGRTEHGSIPREPRIRGSCEYGPGVRELRTLPKPELHVHLEGSLRPPTVLELAAGHGLEPPPQLRGDEWRFRDFDDFITAYQAVLRCLRRPDDFRRMAYEFCEDARDQGVRYAETTLSIAAYGPRLDDWDGPIEWVLEGFAAGERDYGVRCRLVLDVVRNYPRELARPTLETALRHRPYVVALGLGGDEARFGPEQFVDVFEDAAAAGLPAVPHAGEAAGAHSVRVAVEQLHARRIGHGIRALEDPELIEELRDRQVALDVCPTSNVFTAIVPSLEEHPLPRLLDAGLLVTLNSDDPPMFGTSLLGEYELARRVFELPDAELAALARAGIDASFLPEEDKVPLRRAVASWLDAGRGQGRR